MKTIFAVIILVGLSAGSAQANKVSHNFVKVGEPTFLPTPMHVKFGQVGAFDAYLDLATVEHDSGVTGVTVEMRRVGGEGRTARTSATILIVCNRGTYSLDHIDYFDAAGATFHTWHNPTYDRTIPESDSMMASVLDLACQAK